MADLQARFAQFRSAHPPGTRVPAALRTAALAALREGVTTGQLHRVCGISWSQLKAWKARHASSPTAVKEAEASADVRVFSVVDTDSLLRPAPEALELRLGPWSVRVQLAGLAQDD